MVSGSLCPLISFLNVSFSVSFVVRGQRPRRGRWPMASPHREIFSVFLVFLVFIVFLVFLVSVPYGAAAQKQTTSLLLLKTVLTFLQAVLSTGQSVERTVYGSRFRKKEWWFWLFTANWVNWHWSLASMLRGATGLTMKPLVWRFLLSLSYLDCHFLCPSWIFFFWSSTRNRVLAATLSRSFWPLALSSFLHNFLTNWGSKFFHVID